ncbi:MAG: hypothetical protein HZC18_08185 [Candidatus Omnitrophica bacterium]|nr:hypothetical protein [Candidatus Omnitrophota bacterium]
MKFVFQSYNAENIVISSEDASLAYEFDPNGRHQRTLNALTGAVLYQFAYNPDGLLVSVEDADGNVTTIERNGSGKPLAIVAADGQRTEFTLDANGYLASIANPAGETFTAVYSATGLLTSFADPKTNSSQLFYDPDTGRLTKDLNAAGGFWELSRIEVDNSFTVTKSSALNRTTTYLIEKFPVGDQRRVVTDPSGLETQTVRKTNGETNTTYPDGTLTSVTEGPDPRFGMLSPIVKTLKITTPAGLILNQSMTRTVTLTDPNDLLSVATLTNTTTLNGRIFTNAYNASTKTWTETSAAGRQALTTIDSVGRPLTQTIAGIDSIQWSYDTRGRLSQIRQGPVSSQRTMNMTYNTQGYLSGVTDPLSRSTTYMYDLAGRVTRESFPDGRQINYTYDENGNVTSVTPPGRPVHRFTYTPLNFTEDYIAPNVGTGTTTNYLYSLDKQLIRVTRPDAQMLNLNYDTAGRLSTMTFPRGTIQYAYAATTGNLSGITAPGGVGLSFDYDGALPLSTSWNGPVAGSVANVFDNNFRVVSQSVNGADTIGFGYDNDDLLISAGSLSIVRDAGNGLLTGTTLGNVTDALTYTTFAEPQSYTASAGGTEVFKTEYTRDALGRITRKVETLDTVTATTDYAYDVAGRLSEVTTDGVVTARYGYDDNGNRVSRDTGGVSTIGTYDDQDRLLNYGGNAYTYTANGELLTRTAAGQTTTYDYDLLGNLMSAALPDGTNIEYIVDGQNRRIGKKVNGTLAQGFLYDGQIQVVAELDGSNNVVSRFVYGTKGNVPDYMVKGGVTYRIISDHLGSPRLIIDTATGAVVQQIDYDEFGNIVSDTNPGFQPFGFAGGLYDRDTGLVRFGLRDYDAETGRWTSKDPILFAAGDTNVYGYVFNDPVNFIDPDGLRGTFSENFNFALEANRQFFVGTNQKIIKRGTELLIGGIVINTFGFVSLESVAGTVWTGGVANLGVGGTIGSFVVGSLATSAITTFSIGSGILAGSLLDATIQTFFVGETKAPEACPLK